MATEIILPRVDMDMTEGRIARWFAEEGATVRQGEPLFEMETDKAAVEIDAPASGVLRRIVGHTDAAIAVGSTVGWIVEVGEDAPRAQDITPAPSAVPSPAAAPIAAESTAPAVAEPANGATDLRATPLARRLARTRGLNLSRLEGSGPHGRIQARDVPDEAAAAPPPAVSSGRGLHRAWLRQGTGAPVVLLHGFGADLNAWRPFLAAASLGRPVLGIDLPGHGMSAEQAAISIEAFAASVGDALAAESVTELDLVGHSLGAAVAATLAGGVDPRVRTLFLIAPAGLGPDINGAFLDGFARARSEASLAPWMRLLVADETALGPAFIKATAAQRVAADLAPAQQRLGAALFPDGTQSFDIRPALGRIAAPIRILFGTEDRIIPARHVAGLPGRIALHLFPGLGHMPHLEARTEVAALLAAHLKAAG